MNAALRTQAVTLRTKDRLSYTAIVKKLGVSKSTLSYWLREYPLTEKEILVLRRKAWKKGEASRERFRNTMREKKKAFADEVYDQQKRLLANLPKEAFFVAGLTLYLGEGDKRNVSRIGLANSDLEVIKFFIKWLKYFFGVKPKEIRMQLQLYDNMHVDEEVAFWKKSLGISDEQLYKTQIRRVEPEKFSYTGPNRHGTCSIFVNGTKRKMELMMAMKAFLDVSKKTKIMRL